MLHEVAFHFNRTPSHAENFVDVLIICLKLETCTWIVCGGGRKVTESNQSLLLFNNNPWWIFSIWKGCFFDWALITIWLTIEAWILWVVDEFSIFIKIRFNPPIWSQQNENIFTRDFHWKWRENRLYATIFNFNLIKTCGASICSVHWLRHVGQALQGLYRKLFFSANWKGISRVSTI